MNSTTIALITGFVFLIVAVIWMGYDVERHHEALEAEGEIRHDQDGIEYYKD